MLGKKMNRKHIGIAALVCVFAILLPVLLVGAASPWTTQDMVDYMYNIGRHKIWSANYIVKNEIKPAVYEIRDLMGQGLVGESYTHSFVFDTADSQEWTVPAVPTHPKKFSLWVDITTMNEGDMITVTLMIDREGTGNYYIYWDGSAYSTWEWTADADTRFHWQVADQLAISNNWRVKLQISYTPVAPPVTLHCEAIIEEV